MNETKEQRQESLYKLYEKDSRELEKVGDRICESVGKKALEAYKLMNGDKFDSDQVTKMMFYVMQSLMMVATKEEAMEFIDGELFILMSEQMGFC